MPPGTYEGPLSIRKPIQVEAEQTRIISSKSASSDEPLLLLETNGATVRGLQLEGSQDGLVVHGDNNQIQDVAITTSKTAVKLENSNRNLVQKLRIRGSAADLEQRGNGAGKSTLIKMVVGISRPTTGTIRVQGLEWRRNREEYARRIGFMPDDFQFSGGMSAWETLCFYSGLRGVGKQRAAEVMDIVGLTEAGQKQVSAFSKGMRQRLLLAQALLARPALLVLDEPTNGLDPYWMESLAGFVFDASIGCRRSGCG
ncbi:ATP-binding cassette domain-containing protein [Tumebacillus flagellatus]|uniref:ATP-binding cassette domain-containing protein n=1 Tax=Tumebacillus flagellatus TaxID=1157490 RepID=UPI00069078B6|nr:ATP-binding cassette domain-containing protein [Tumebacillus flagellatus]